MKAWRSLLLVAAFVACIPFTASADDVVVAQINGVDIKQSDLDFAASAKGVPTMVIASTIAVTTCELS